MSVIRFSKQEFINMAEAVRDNQNKLKYTILYSEAYLRKMNHSDNEEKAVSDLIYWLFDHLNKANLFAFISQYGLKKIDLDEYELGGEYPDRSSVYSVYSLISELRSLDYNLADNAGNKFIEPIYYNLFIDIKNELIKSIYEKADELRIHKNADSKMLPCENF